ncbi:MAG: replication-associated recombination protein A [Thermoanaerobaculia bacterium]
MRPRSLDEVAGHRELLGPTGFVRRAVADDRVPSLIFWGPPGCGKTTLARVIAESTKSRFVPFSAVTSGIKEIKEVMADAVKLRTATGRRTLLFVDEIHRFNRAQQDAFLPYVERGDIVLFGATTENPSFELNAALLSRCRVVVLSALDESDLLGLLRSALGDPSRGLGESGIEADPDALLAIARLANGDARRALGLLELAAGEAAASGLTRVTSEAIEHLAQRKVLLYDKSGDEHFNIISALHKSLRESDPDAALYWLTRMLVAGEDPNYVARRLVRFASEDVGLADPQALPQALAGWQSYERLGTPEGEVALAQVAIYLALAPKSIAVYRAYGEARRTIEERPAEPVPLALRNAPTKLMKGLGYGREYIYAPDTDQGVAGLECLPEAMSDVQFYRPSDKGFEVKLDERMREFARRRKAARDGRRSD